MIIKILPKTYQPSYLRPLADVLIELWDSTKYAIGITVNGEGSDMIHGPVEELEMMLEVDPTNELSELESRESKKGDAILFRFISPKQSEVLYSWDRENKQWVLNEEAA